MGVENYIKVKYKTGRSQSGGGQSIIKQTQMKTMEKQIPTKRRKTMGKEGKRKRGKII